MRKQTKSTTETDQSKTKTQYAEKKTNSPRRKKVDLRKVTESWSGTVEYIIVRLAIVILLIYEIVNFVVSKVSEVS